MLVEKLFPSGAYEIRGDGFVRVYYGYTKREAIAEWKREKRDAKI